MQHEQIALDYEVTEQKEALYEAIAALLADALRQTEDAETHARTLLYEALCRMWNTLLGTTYRTREEIAMLHGAYGLARDLLAGMQDDDTPARTAAPQEMNGTLLESLASVTSEEFQHQRDALICILTEGRLPAAQPLAYLIAGQPGAGKITMADLFTGAHSGNIIFISGDAYRPFHPHIAELRAHFGDDAVLHTQEFAGRMTEALIDALSAQGYHLIIEGTLRTQEAPLRTRELLAARGYRVSLNVLAVPPLLSYLGTLRRYARMREFGMHPRRTPREHHDRVVRDIAANLDALDQMHRFDAIRLYDRTGACLYEENQQGGSPAEALRRAMARPFSAEERDDLRRIYAPYVPEDLLDEALHSY